ncbi:MAG: hypothetical protein H7096_14455, partial [Flavobacterium sp.]|nr:hypothetical protein [Pedobacter sp.]
MKRILYILCAVILFLAASWIPPVKDIYQSWSTFAGSNDGIRYSSGNEINTQNVSKLQVAWV